MNPALISPCEKLIAFSTSDMVKALHPYPKSGILSDSVEKRAADTSLGIPQGSSRAAYSFSTSSKCDWQSHKVSSASKAITLIFFILFMFAKIMNIFGNSIFDD